MRRIRLAAMVLGIMTAVVAAQPKYGVTVTAEKKVDFSAFRTYVWRSGWSAADKAVHQQIVDAIDRELANVGLEKRTSEPADVAVLYATVQHSHVDLETKMKEENGLRKEYPVGTLVFLMRDPVSNRDLLRGRADKLLDTEPARLKAIIEGAVAEIFAKYPTRHAK